jgi:energy-converting hydrogenase Eha subunit E
MTITRLSGGLTPADGADPRTFPTIWNGTADDLEAGEFSRVPTGGSAGQVLVKDSATDYDAVWGEDLGLASQVAETYNTGRWAQTHQVASIGGALGAGLLLGQMFGVVLRVEKPTKYDRIGCEVTVASATATDQARLGVYKIGDGPVSNEHDLILDAGTINLDTTGIKEVTIDLTLNRGLYLLIFVRQNTATSAVTMRAVAGADTFVGAEAMNNSRVGFASGTSDTVLGALPVQTTGGQLNQGSQQCAMVRLRKADF